MLKGGREGIDGGEEIFVDNVIQDYKLKRLLINDKSNKPQPLIG